MGIGIILVCRSRFSVNLDVLDDWFKVFPTDKIINQGITRISMFERRFYSLSKILSSYCLFGI